MNALRTEDDLRDALDELSAGAPSVDAVLPRPDRHRRKLAWVAPLAAALLVLAVAVVIAVNRASHREPAAGPPPRALVGKWDLLSVGGHAGGYPLILWVKPDGTFWREDGICVGASGHITVSGASLRVERSVYRAENCPDLLKGDSLRQERIGRSATLQMFKQGTMITWLHDANRLTLTRSGVPTLVYVPWHVRK